MLRLDQLEQIRDTIAAVFDLDGVGEVTLECNPEDLSLDYLHGLATMRFVSRLSIGVQSFSDNLLHRLNRRHNARQALDAVRNAREAGFSNVSIDLIYGSQPLDDFMTDLRQLDALSDCFDHLSAYSLTVEPHTMLETQIREGRFSPLSDDEVVAQYDRVLQWCGTHGFEQYEISNFAKPGFSSRHNSRYWNRTPYLGVGAAAHSFDGLRRRWNDSDSSQYCQLLKTGRIIHEEEELTLKDAYNELVMTALRTTAGIDKGLVGKTFENHLIKSVQPLIQRGLLVETPSHYQPTAQGLLLADSLALDLMA